MPKVSRRKEITKIRAETDEIRDSKKKKPEKISKTKSQFFEKINKIDKPIAILNKNTEVKSRLIGKGRGAGKD